MQKVFFSGEHCRTFALFLPPQICPNVEESIAVLEQHLQAMNGITTGHSFIKNLINKTNAHVETTDAQWVTNNSQALKFRN